MNQFQALPLSPPVFSILSGLIEEKAGLHYGLLDRDLLQEKASARAIEAGFESLLDYYYFLRYDDVGSAELNELLETLVVNETYFFREWPALRTLVNEFIAPWCATGRRVRVWSAACSTGEEPLSLAMLLAEKDLLSQVDIVATDISQRVLNRAQSGKFSKRAIRLNPDRELQAKHLSSIEEGFKIREDLVKAIRWERKNLLHDDQLATLGAFDVILCRNVLIYFADPTVRSVLNSLAARLKDDGVLLVGVSESLLRYGSNFIGEERAGTFIYRKGGSQ